MTEQLNFILGLDLDGTCADFYGRMREIAAIWTGRPLDDLPEEPEWSMGSWGIGNDDYERFHRYAVTEHQLFESMQPLPGSPEVLARLSDEGVRVRIITHRLILSSLHEITVLQTVRWLDRHRIPYWDLCFMREKDDVNADLYVEDAPYNVERLAARGCEVLVMANATNEGLELGFERTGTWREAEAVIRGRYYRWLDEHSLSRPERPGATPSWLLRGNAPTSRA
jgi:phosphoglycolate phosphatase-like HAD superfamily hydrolase